MKRKRRNHSAEFKAKVALAALRGIGAPLSAGHTLARLVLNRASDIAMARKRRSPWKETPNLEDGCLEFTDTFAASGRRRRPVPRVESSRRWRTRARFPWLRW